MINEHDAVHGYRFYPERIGFVGGVLVLNTGIGVVHVSLSGNGYNVDAYPSNGKAGRYTVPYIENARELGVTLLIYAARGADIS